MQADYLLFIAIAAVILLLVLIMRFKLHAFVALVIISILTALAAGIKLDAVVATILGGFGSTLASIALLVGLGAMIGKLLEASGGAAVLANTLVMKFGQERAPFALGIASLLFAFPIFFDAGLIVMLPIILSVAKRAGGSLLAYALPSVGAFSVMHVFLPPHPGPVAAAALLGANVGYVLFIGLIIAIPTWYFSSYLFALVASKSLNVKIPQIFDSYEAHQPLRVPRFSEVIGVLLVPVVLIFINTLIDTLIKLELITNSNIAKFFMMIGQTQVALLITLIATLFITRKSFSAKQIERLCESSLAPICSVILVTGAGGMFGGVLRASGIGDALASMLANLGVPVLLAGFLIAAALRIAQGSATVALTTAAALLAPVAINAGLSDLGKCCVVLSVACGSVVCSHFNDSGFWLVKGLFEVDEKTTLKTWTVLETLIGVIGFIFVAIIYCFA